MSAVAHSTFGSVKAGRRRATPSTDSTASSPASASQRLVPTFPVAPVMTIRITIPLTHGWDENRAEITELRRSVSGAAWKPHLSHPAHFQAEAGTDRPA